MIDLPDNFEKCETEYNRQYDPYDTPPIRCNICCAEIEDEEKHTCGGEE